MAIETIQTAPQTSPRTGSSFQTNQLPFLVQPYAVLLGRLLLCHIFLLSGFSKIMDWSGTAQQMAGKGMPMVPLFLAGAILCEILGGLSLLVGFRARLGALLLFLYLIPVTLVFHNFWAYDGVEHKMQMINFMKNLAIMGGMALVIGFGAGSISIDRWQERNAR
jgi:putative oxidoreductase